MIKKNITNTVAAFRHATDRHLDTRAAVVMHRLFADCDLMDAAKALQEHHGLAAAAFLLGAIRPKEIEPEKLEDAFRAHFMGSYPSIEAACDKLAEAAFDAARQAAETDPSLLIAVTENPDRFLTDFAHHVVLVHISEAVFVFSVEPAPASTK